MKIERYYNYGMCIESMPNQNDIVDMKMFFSVYELDNGNIVCLESIKYYNNHKEKYEWGEFADGEKYNTFYLLNYNFGDDFYDWFDNVPKWTPDSQFPDSQEHKLVSDFYETNLKQLNK